jgi:hypothetical protein
MIRDPHPDTPAQVRAVTEQTQMASACWMGALILGGVAIAWSVLRTPRSKDRQQLHPALQIVIGLLPVAGVGFVLFSFWWFPGWKAEQVSRAIDSNDPALMTAFLDRKLHLDPQTRRRILFWAAGEGHTGVVQSMLDQGLGADERFRGDPVLVRAASEGQPAVVKLLLQRGARVDATNTSGATALHAAERAGHQGIVRILREAGAKAEP